MLKCFKTLWIAPVLALVLTGCENTSSQSVFDDSEMAKYRSTPEEIQAAQEAAKTRTAPSSAEIKKMAAEASAAAKSNAAGR